MLEELALYSFSNKSDAITLSIRGLGGKKPVESQEARLSDLIPSFFSRKETCEVQDHRISCHAPDAKATRQYIRHFNDVAGLVYLFIENTYAPAHPEQLDPASFAKSKYDSERVVGSVYHCISPSL
ncbi:hypothetical protein WDW86_13275 [Bdellovibrionota bacterium FG-2]